jgi:hypothetical protein
MKKQFITIGLSLFSMYSAFAVPLDANSLRLKIYKMAVSTSPNCSSPITVFERTNPQYTEFKGGPTLGSGRLDNGTYPCVIIEFSDKIKVTPDSNVGVCFNTVETTQDVCSSGTSELIDGSTTTCGGADNRVAMYITTANDGTSGSDAFNPPTCNTAGCTAVKGFQLGSALTVSGSAVAKFTVNTDDKVCDGNDGAAGACAGENLGTCNMLPPDFSFTQTN